jgi:hypothetical protein
MVYLQLSLLFGPLEKRLNSHAFHACIQGFESPTGHHGRLAQLGEHLPYKQGVGGSIPSAPTIYFLIVAGWSSTVARRAHNPKVAGSNPVPATKQGAVVKLEFTPVCHTGGRGFESRQLRHLIVWSH